MRLVKALKGPNRSRRAAWPGLIGMTLDRAAESNFFLFFGLVQVRGHAQDSPLICRFRPGGSNPDVEVNVEAGHDTIIRGIELVLARSFVEAPETAIFARDIAKSFLRDAPPPAAAAALAELADEIWTVPARSRVVLGSAGALPKDKQAPSSPVYRVFLGDDRRPVVRDLAGAILIAEEIRESGANAFRLILRGPVAPAPDGNREAIMANSSFKDYVWPDTGTETGAENAIFLAQAALCWPIVEFAIVFVLAWWLGLIDISGHSRDSTVQALYFYYITAAIVSGFLAREVGRGKTWAAVAGSTLLLLISLPVLFVFSAGEPQAWVRPLAFVLSLNGVRGTEARLRLRPMRAQTSPARAEPPAPPIS